MKPVFEKIMLVTGFMSLLAGCHEKESVGLISGQVICRGGCFRQAYYVDVKGEKLKGKAQTVTDDTGVSRGQFNNVLIINNLKNSDQQEGKIIFFKYYQDTEVSCQSSYPRAIREIDITY